MGKEYVNNEELYKEICISLKREPRELTPRAVTLLMLIAENAIKKLHYEWKEDEEDCLQFAKLELLKYWKSFNPRFLNAFSYYTQMAKNGYAKGWNTLYPKKYKGTMSMSGALDEGHADLPI